MEFYKKSVKEVADSFKTNLEKGIAQNTAQKLLNEKGRNKLKSDKKINHLVLFLNQFKSFIIYILLFALIISAISGEIVDSIAIFTILFFNAIFGFIQEYKAEKAIAALKKLSALKSRVLRNGKEISIDSEEIVPGDIMLLNEGDKISADGRILDSVSLQVSEASLTGESAPVSKISDALKGDLQISGMKNMVFSGTAVTSGRAKAIVTSTGMQTQIGKIAGMIREVKEEQTPLQKKLESLGKWIGVAVLAISTIVFITGILKNGSLTYLLSGNMTEFIFRAKDGFLTAVALAVAAVPEGLPAIVTIALALGVRRMAKRNSLIRKLPSVETLGETTVICSDKTGTLTKNEMTVKKAFTNLKEISIEGHGYEIKGKIDAEGKSLTEKELLLFKIGVLCNNASIKTDSKTEPKGDPTEISLLVSAEKAGIKTLKLREAWKILKENPFSSERKMMSVITKDPKTKKEYVFAKGAPEIILENCTHFILNGKIKTLSPAERKKILSKNEEFTKKALRVLGFAYKPFSRNEKTEEKLIFVGLQGMIDPPRESVKESIQKCRDAGIRVVMITGDNVHTAEAIAKEIGITGPSLTGKEFDKMSEKEKSKSIKNISIFGRVNPSHKMEIVKLLQKKGEVVAMTGDGVNDAPALKKADIGIAMGIKGTDVSKESSDMILQDDNFTTIVNSVEEGRGIYENIRKFVNYLLSSNLAEVLVIFLAILFAWPLPMTAIMLLWINLVTDGLPALSLSVDKNPKNLMKRPPKKAKDRIMNRSMMFNILFVSVLITIAVLSLFYWALINYAGLAPNEVIEKAQTIAFTSIIIMELVRLQAIRSEYKLGILSNKYLVLAVLASIFLQLTVIYTPLSVFFGTTFLNLKDWGMIISVTAIVFVVNMIGIKIRDKISFFKD